jgi:hypothetical protein
MFGPPFEDPADVHLPIAARRAMPASVTIPASPAVPHKAVGDGYAELTGQMVVAGPRRRSVASGKSRQLRADRRSRTSGNDVVLPIPCANYAVQILGSLAFLFAAGDNIPLLLLGVVLFGAGIGNTTSLPPMIAQAEFSQEDVSRVVPLIVAVGQGTYAFAPAVFGLIRELAPRWGSASAGAAPWLFLAAALIQILAVVAFFIGRPRKA